MKIGEKIRKFRLIRQATQLDLGYHVKLSDLRVGQYETGKRNPKDDLVERFAQALDVEPAALSNNEPDTIDGLMHTLFDLEETFNLTIEEDYSDGEEEYVFRFKPTDENKAEEMRKAFSAWLTAYEKYHTNPESEEEKKLESDMYELWKGQYPNNLTTDPLNGMTICRETREWKL
ncbi:MAG: helix-turn-helix transcriptional regulator [Bacteroidaceae bacterium]|nr:helix-turn-helix transcriptional regulator [Bacteroidaceae bacterium]MCQ2088210.1 helix-turn-helix transcriptional regulator [Bacilli bacterium]MCQ2499630.1 helix-turn-helix transcriptional regulator [Lachnospiraceae bacterium]MDO5441971.1 helix-turn-helix transcriptional regulator [Bacillota bacterium]